LFHWHLADKLLVEWANLHPQLQAIKDLEEFVVHIVDNGWDSNEVLGNEIRQSVTVAKD